MPTPLTGQTERTRQASERVDVTVGDHRDAHVIAGPAGGFVDECLRAQLSTDDRAARAAGEHRYLAEAATLTDRLVVLPRVVRSPVGAEQLRALTAAPVPA